jgi:hypothetical protein
MANRTTEFTSWHIYHELGRGVSSRYGPVFYKLADAKKWWQEYKKKNKPGPGRWYLMAETVIRIFEETTLT